MKYFKLEYLKNFFTYFKSETVSMRRRFALYIFSVICVFLALILILLNLFGILNPTEQQIRNEMDAQLLSFSKNVEHDINQLAAYAISYGDQLETSIQDYLSDHNLSFEDLKDNPEILEDLQLKLYPTVYLNMQLASCSGSFYILDSTVNSRSIPPLYSGIYLKHINLYSESTVNNDFALYRGSFMTGKANGITFHSGWKNENDTSFFKTWEDTFTEGIHYAVSPVVEIPETWETARYVYVPIRDLQKNVIGVCGFEFSDLLFQLSYKLSSPKLGSLSCALLDKNTQIPNFSLFEFQNKSYIGNSDPLYLGNDTFYSTVMISQPQYEQFLRKGQINLSMICCIVGILAFGCCITLSQKYISPLLRKIEQLKSPSSEIESFNIREIDDLFTFLAEKDHRYEEQLLALEKEKSVAEDETRKAKEDYEKALKKYELAKDEIDRLAQNQLSEIVPDEYEFFISNLETLTVSEYRIYELYLSGNTAKQISEILGISENTLKFHNKNIYSKLGISSRKQLLRFASLKQYQDNYAK